MSTRRASSTRHLPAARLYSENAYGGAVLADSPLAWWRLGDASGTTMTDASGNSRNGTYYNSPILGAAGLVANDPDTAVTFNGTNQYAQVAYGSWLDVGTITLEAIVKLTTTGNNYSILDRDNSTRCFQFRISSGNKFQLIFWTTTGGPFTVTGATTIAAATAYHLAATYDGTTAILYVNGSSDGSLAQSGTFQSGASTSAYFTIADSNNSGPTQFFPGTIDEAAYYGTALSATRIAAHATAAGL